MKKSSFRFCSILTDISLFRSNRSSSSALFCSSFFRSSSFFSSASRNRFCSCRSSSSIFNFTAICCSSRMRCVFSRCSSCFRFRSSSRAFRSKAFIRSFSSRCLRTSMSFSSIRRCTSASLSLSASSIALFLKSFRRRSSARILARFSFSRWRISSFCFCLFTRVSCSRWISWHFDSNPSICSSSFSWRRFIFFIRFSSASSIVALCFACCTAIIPGVMPFEAVAASIWDSAPMSFLRSDLQSW
mmetsp:Transcript_48325/g.65769  ORF Transcript_48325/g.65769 Transcript_48325/m.65769 type:complete len:244 (-) Transcript_48325:410-1141(-)